MVEELCDFLEFRHFVGMLSATQTTTKPAQPALSNMGQMKFNLKAARVRGGSPILTQHFYSATLPSLAAKLVSIVDEAIGAFITLLPQRATRQWIASFTGRLGAQLVAGRSRSIGCLRKSN